MCLEKDGVISFFLSFLAAGSFVCLLFSREDAPVGFLAYLMALCSLFFLYRQALFGGGHVLFLLKLHVFVVNARNTFVLVGYIISLYIIIGKD